MILYVQWHSFMNKGIEKAFAELGIQYDIFFYQFNDWEKDEVFESKLESRIRSRSYEAVFGINYSPLISNVCESLGLPYIFWVYDSPIHIRDISSLKNTCNIGYFFDRGQALEYTALGINAFHLPLAADPTVFKVHNAPRSQVSFLGQLYNSDYNYYLSPLSEHSRGYLDGILTAQSKLYGAYLLPDLVTDELMNQLNQQYLKASNNTVAVDRREMIYMMAQEITFRERFTVLSLLSKYFYVSVYSSGKNDLLSNVEFHPYADYYNEMPSVFANSDINLNISLKTIQTGVPLRVFDILSCNGFCISNYQSEIPELFTIGEDIEVYESMEDLYQKAKFYLAHPDIMNRIASNGYSKILVEHSFNHRIGEIFKHTF